MYMAKKNDLKQNKENKKKKNNISNISQKSLTPTKKASQIK